MVGGDETKGHGRPQGDATGGVATRHHAVHVIARGVKAGDGLALGVQNLCLVIGVEAGIASSVEEKLLIC